MKPKVFLDTNVMLDLLLEREGFAEAAEILQLHDDGVIEVCQSSLSLANIAYILRKIFSPQFLAPTMLQLASVAEVLPLGGDDIRRALMLDGRDYEDMLQLSCAMAGGCETVVTRNAKDFIVSGGLLPGITLPQILTPSDFLAKVSS